MCPDRALGVLVSANRPHRSEPLPRGSARRAVARVQAPRDAARRARRARVPGRVGLGRLPRHRRGVWAPAASWPAGVRATSGPDRHSRHQGHRGPRPEHHRGGSRGTLRRAVPRRARGSRSGSTAYAARYAAARGILLADTKFEFGVDEDGEVVLADEALTPDSSRLWPADGYAPGGPQPSFDKQYVRDWCLATGWDRRPPGPELPAEVVSNTRRRYVDAFERLTGIPFERYLDDPQVVSCA